MKSQLMRPLYATIALALLIAPGLGSAADSAPRDKFGVVPSSTNSRVLANEILDRWEPVAAAAGMRSAAWREVLEAQLGRMELPILASLSSVTVDSSNAKASYQRFEGALKSAIMQEYMAGQSGKGRMKLGSVVTDQVFVPITPCRVVDTRISTGTFAGKIDANTQRSFYFYSNGAGWSWAAQGGAGGMASTACPGTALVADGGTLGAPPSAAVASITVVNPTQPGNFIAWGGAGGVPGSSALNWSQAGQVLASTTILPAGGRTGGALDFTIRYNGPSGSADVVVDVVGYMVENEATPLECVDTALSSMALAANQVSNVPPPACPTGYTLTSMTCGVVGEGWVNAIVLNGTPQCWGHAPAGQTDTVSAGSHCCRVPGR